MRRPNHRLRALFPQNNLMKEAAAESLTMASTTEKSWVSVLSELVKARLTFLVLLTTLVGFYLGERGPIDYLLMVHTLVATALLASGASALNQLLEREHDARMVRTQDRPLPSGRGTAPGVLVFGGGV